MMLKRALSLLILAALTAGCMEPTLPTIGRSVGDMPMSRLVQFDSNEKCFRFRENVSFEAPFADGMAYSKKACLKSGKKIGRLPIETLATMHVSLTSDGEYYIVKNGY